MAKHIPMYVSQLDPGFTSFRAEEVDARDLALGAQGFIDTHLLNTRKFRSEEARHVERDRIAGFLEFYMLKVITGQIEVGQSIAQAIQDFKDGLNVSAPLLNTEGKLQQQPDLTLENG